MNIEALQALWGAPKPEPFEALGRTEDDEEAWRLRKSLVDLPNEILLQVLAPLCNADLLQVSLASHRFYDLARRTVQGNLIAAIGLSDLRVILESFHPAAVWMEPYLYCLYLGTPGLGVDGAEEEAFYGAERDHPRTCKQAEHQNDASLVTAREIVYDDPRAPPCEPRGMALLLRNVYSRFRPLVPNAMAVTETRHPAGGRMAVRTGNIQRAASISTLEHHEVDNGAGPSETLSSSAPPASTLGQGNTAPSAAGMNASAAHNAMLLTDRLRTTNPNAGPVSHAFAEGAVLRAQMDQTEASSATRRAVPAGDAQLRRTMTASSVGSSSASELPELSQAATNASSRTDTTLLTAADEDLVVYLDDLPLVSHSIPLEPLDSFSQLITQTSLIGSERRRGVFGQLLPINSNGVVRLWREWLEERVKADAEGRRDEWEEKKARTLWVANSRHGVSRNVGFRVRVKKVERAANAGAGQRNNVDEWVMQYEELLIRTAHLQEVVDKHRAGELDAWANNSIVFGRFLERYNLE